MRRGSKPSRAFFSARPARPLAPFSPPPLFRRGSSETDAQQLWQNYGLLGELKRKFGLSDQKESAELCKDIFHATATLPAAIFFSVAGSTEDARWALASHGGFEPSGSVRAFLSTAIPENAAAAYAAFGAIHGPGVFARKTWHSVHGKKGSDPQGPDTVGEYKWKKKKDDALLYQWADIAEDDKTFFDSKSCENGRCALGKPLILQWMRDNNVVTLFRGHQHSGYSLKGANACVVLSPR